MSAAGTMISTLITQTIRKRNVLAEAVFGGLAGAGCWAVTAVFLLVAWPYRGRSYSPDAAILYPMLFPVFGCVSGLALGTCIGWVAAVASRAAERSSAGRWAGTVTGALIGACAGVLAVGAMLAWQQRNAGALLYSMLLHVGFLERPLAAQYLTGMLPGIVCGIVGAQPQPITSSTCAACGGAVRPDATSCKHCGAAFTSYDKPSRWKTNLKWLAIVGSVLLGLFGIATWIAAQDTIGVPELDTYTLQLGKVRGEHTRAELTAVLGEPPLTYWTASGTSEEWAYPIRAESWSNERATPAVILEVRLDRADRVAGWGFYHPITHAQLPIRENLAHAQQWLNERGMGSESQIELASLLHQGAPKREVVIALAEASHNLPYMMVDYDKHFEDLERIFARPAAAGDGEVLHFYVDHPSPLLIPPFLYIRMFDESGNSPVGYVSGY